MSRPKTIKRKTAELWCLAGCVLVVFFIIFSPFLFGGELFLYLDVNDDTFQSYLPSYQLVVNMLQQGNFSLYSTAYGLGDNLLSMQMMIFDPFSWPVVLVGLLAGLEKMAGALLFAQLLRILGAALACHFFLRAFSFSPPIRVAASVLAAFSAFAVGGIGQHYMFASTPFFIFLLLGILERSFRGRHWLFVFVLVVAWVALWSVYFCYMMLLACGIFSVLRFFQQAGALDVKNAVRWFVPLLAAVLVGFLLSAALTLPTALVMFGTSDRLATDVSLAQRIKQALRPYDAVTAKSIFLRMFSDQLQNGPSAMGNFNVIHMFCSVLLPIALPQYLVFQWRRRKEKRAWPAVLFVLLVCVSCFIPLFGLVFNAFVAPMQRYAFVMLPAFAYLMAWLLTSIKQKEYHVAIGWVSTAVYAIFIWRWSPWNGKVANISAINAIISLMVVTLALTLLQVAVAKKIRSGLAVVLAGVVVAGVCVESITGLVVERQIVTKEEYAAARAEDMNMQYVIREYGLQEPAFQRADRAYTGYSSQPTFTYGMVAYFRSLGYYNSVPNANLQRYQQEMLGVDLYTAAAYSRAAMGMPLDTTAADVLGLTYVLTNQPVTSPAWELRATLEGGYVYQNISGGAGGLLYHNWYSEEDFATLSPLEKQAVAAHAICVGEGDVSSGVSRGYEVPLELKTDALHWAEKESGMPVGARLEVGGQETLVLNVETERLQIAEQQAFLTFDVMADAAVTFFAVCDTGFGVPAEHWAKKQFSVQPGIRQELILKLPADTQAVHFSVAGESGLTVENMALRCSNGRGYNTDAVLLENPRLGPNMDAHVETDTPGIVLIPVPYEKGWAAWLNGKPVTVLRGNLGFLAVEVPAGSHQLSLQYKVPGLGVGIAASFVGLAVYLGVLWGWRRRQPARKQPANAPGVSAGGKVKDDTGGFLE